MDTGIVIALAAIAVAAAAVLFAILQRRDGGNAELADTVRRVADAQAELAGRLSQMAEGSAASQAQLAERLQVQERALSKTLEERLADVSKKVGDSLTQSSVKTQETIGQLQQRLAVIDAAQKNITELSTQVVGLQDILSNKQARGAFGEVQLHDLVQNALPPSAYQFQATLANGRRADCLLKLPNPPGPIVIDSKFPLESYHAIRNATDDAARQQAGRTFSAAVLTHVRDIAERYIIPGETAESALMFLPSEAVHAELHANFPDVVEKAYRARVWIVSPTSLWATLNTVRAVLKDVHMREQASVIQREVMVMLEDVTRLDDRVGKLQRHFDQASEDMRQIRISTEKIGKKGESIANIELEESDDGDESIATAPNVSRLERKSG